MSGGERSTELVRGFHSFTLAYRGRNAQVYRAVSERSEVTVALKVMEETQGLHETTWLRDLGGARGVVPLLDIARAASGAPVAVMPFYPDGSYIDILRGQGALPQVYEAVRVGRAVAGALEVMHGQGVLHNEVAPSNILRAGDTAVLTDFGATAEIGVPPPKLRTSSDLVLHAPPEILRGTPPGPASDTYQLASTLWTLLAGWPPFFDADGSSVDPQTYAKRAVRTPVPPVPRADAPRELSEVLARAMAKDPAERHATPGEFEVALERAGTGYRSTAVPEAASPSASVAPPTAHQPGTGTRPPAPEPPRPPDTDTSATSLRGGVRRRRPDTQPAAPPSPGGPPAPPPPNHPSAPPDPPQRSSEPVDPGRGKRPGQDARRSHEPAARPAEAPRSPEGAGLYTSGLEGNSKDTIGLTADLVARLRGVTLNKDLFAQRGWIRLEGWTSRANTLSLPDLADRDAHGGEDGPDYGDLDPRNAPRWRRHLHIAAAVASIVVVAGAVSVVAAMNPGPGLNGEGPRPVAAAEQDGADDAAGAAGAEDADDEEPGDQPESSPSPAPEEPPDVPEATEVVLEDNLSSVQVQWTDNSGGTASYFVVGGMAGHDPVTLARTGPGAEVAQVTTDDTVAEYCFSVVAVDGVSAPAAEVCTERAAARSEAEQEAEQEREEQEEQEEEQEEESEDGDSAQNSDGNEEQESE
ncbi:serine/threonine protein kinase [Lipingzhangella halophila]|uniref:non-specific serine/threonine protein kinase n=1 Tax=Lipingzhangella halophila TaxID=1783352 RepID=A0A7W7RLK4_9ACTN|nr:serine/threonine-protein kinase [Lipingzhangella halophila]MBB4934233.1 serine/threonine protein kinase [Lipingzhangella halophila]